MQLPPHHLLQGFVKHYLILENNTTEQQAYRIFSDGNPGIVFHLKDPLQQQADGDLNLTTLVQPRSFIYGQLTRYNTIVSQGALRMVVVVLQPYALFTHFGTLAADLNDFIIPLADFFGQEAANLEEQVNSISGIKAVLNIIEQFLLKQVIKLHPLTADIALALQVIHQHNGIITIDTLLNKVPVTERQLERRFRECIGTTPKRFADTIKFQHLLKCLQKKPGQQKMKDIIYECGYYDQAHLANNFRKITGFAPNHYQAISQLLAINLMPVS